MAYIADVTKGQTLVLGQRGSGKTFSSKYYCIDNESRTLVFSPHVHDFENESDLFYFWGDVTEDEYGLKTNKSFPQDAEKFFKQAYALLSRDEIDVVFIDEPEMIFKMGQYLEDEALNFFANFRHAGGGVVLMTRRPQNIPSYIADESTTLVCFAISGGRVKRKLNEWYSGLGDMVAELPFEHEAPNAHIVKELGQPPQRYEAEEF